MLTIRSNGLIPFEVLSSTGSPLFNVGSNPGGTAVVNVLGVMSIFQLLDNGITPICLDSGHLLAMCSSSLRYKKNIGHFYSGLNIIDKLNPIAFDWKQGGSHDFGLAAEDVEKVEPLLVTHNKEGQVEGVKYDRVGVVLINAVNEQQAQIEQLKNLIAKQQEQINNQQNLARREHARIAAQKQQLDALKRLVCRKHSATKVCR